MKQNRIAALFLSGLFLSVLLAGCGTTVVVSPENSQTPASESPAASGSAVPSGDSSAVKTGLCISTSLGNSKDADADADGLAQVDISLVAVTVDENGVIDSCVIDGIQAEISFGADGSLITDPATLFESKNELGERYGMHQASPIGKEWNEQAAAFAQYAQGKTVAELKGIALNESGKATDADLAASVTISLGGFISGIETAVNNAQHLGAQRGDRLSLSSETHMSSSKDAGADEDGLAQAYATIAAVTLNGDTVTSCYIDSVIADVNFNTDGQITTDLSLAPPTKNEMGDGYGMHKASSIGKDWDKQAASFCEYITGKTIAEITGLAVDESGKATDVDLAASVTVGIGTFLTLIEKAAG